MTDDPIRRKPKGTHAQRRRAMKNARKIERRRSPGWRTSRAAAKAVFAYDSRAALAAMDARLERVGLRRVPA